MNGIMVERISLFCDTCKKRIITRKTNSLDKHHAALLVAVEKHKQAQPDKPHDIRAKFEATA